MNIPNSNLKRIVIAGGGFGGLQLAKNLPVGKYQVVMIDRHNYHCFQPLLYQVATAGLEAGSIAFPLRKIFQTKEGFYFRMTEVKEVDAERRKVITTIGDLSYDFLVLATGSATNFFGNESLERHSMSMKTITEALNIRSLLLQNFEKALLTDDLKERQSLMNVVIVGGGPTGVELAGAVSELKKHILPRDYPDLDFRWMDVKLLEAGDQLLSGMADISSQKAEKYLKKLGVQVMTNTMVKGFDGKSIQTADSTIPAQTLIWAAGVHCKPPKGLVPSAIAKGNRIAVDEFNRVKGHKHIFAIGDAAQMSTEKYPQGHPMVAQPAIQQGRNLAKNLLRDLKDKPWRPFKYIDLGSMATIGRTKAVSELPGWKSQGAIAWLIWIFVHLMALVGFRNRLVVFITWTYNFINYNRDIRLIIRPFRSFEERRTERLRSSEVHAD